MFDEMFCHPPSCIWTRPRSEKAAVATMCSGGSSCANLSIVPYERRIYLWCSGPMRRVVASHFGITPRLAQGCRSGEYCSSSTQPATSRSRAKVAAGFHTIRFITTYPRIVSIVSFGSSSSSVVSYRMHVRAWKATAAPMACSEEKEEKIRVAVLFVWLFWLEYRHPFVKRDKETSVRRMQETKEQTRPPHGDDNVSLRRCDGDKKCKHSTYACAFCVPHGQTYQISLTIIASFVTLHIRKDQGSRNPRHLTKPTCLLYRMVQRWTIAGTGSQQHRWVERRTGWKGKQQKASN
ncbi:hypothetical protein GW17_00000849 [Ensete ventricosum]|nr:hypothetical protein GW17_00000849 [Ensete ventricosum]